MTDDKLSREAEVAGTLLEVKSGLNGMRGVREGLMQLAERLAGRGAEARGLLVLVDSGVSQARLSQEWRLASAVLRPELANRIKLLTLEREGSTALPADLEPELAKFLSKFVEPSPTRVRGYPHQVHYEVLKLLVRRRLLHEGPVTTDWLAKTVGCTYRPVASALARLGRVVKRNRSRMVELSHFPEEEWAELLAVSGWARSTRRFADRSGQPRSQEELLRRLEGLARPELGLGGVLGAKHYFPDLDLVGIPRLDLTVHSPARMDNLDFVAWLDPAFGEVTDPDIPARLVVHFLRRKETFFEGSAGGAEIADPVECLLDLQEAGLTAQAREFINYVAMSRRSRG